MKEGRVQPTAFSYSRVPQSDQISLIFIIFYKFLQHMSKHWCYTLRKVLAEVFVDEESDLDPGVAVSFSNLGGQVCKTRQEDSVEMTVFRLFDAELKIQQWHCKYSFLYLSLTAERWNDIYWKLSTVLPAHLINIIDRFYIALFSAFKQTHCTRMWCYMSE